MKLWRKFHYGMMTEEEKADLDPEAAAAMLEMESYFRGHYSFEAAVLKYLEAMSENMVDGFRAMIKTMSKRR